MKTLGLLSGAHIHTPDFIRRINGNPEVSVSHVWDHDSERAGACAAGLGAKVANTPEEVLADPLIDAVIICSETDRHEALAMAAVQAGKNLFVEKPLGFAGADAVRIARAVEDSGLLFQTGYFMRGNPAHLQVRKWIADGTLGTITRVRHSTCHSGSLRGIFDSEWRWMADPEISGCGAFGDLGTHSLDILLWLFGPVSRVTGSIRGWTGHYPDCDESGEAILEFRSGIVGTLAAGWLDVADPVTLQVSGTTGMASVVNGALYLRSEGVAGADGVTPWSSGIAAWPHAFDLFLDALAGKNAAPLVTATEAAERSVVMEAIYRAARERCWVELPGA